MNDKIGIRIRKTRERNGLTQAELASRCGMHAPAIGRYERGTQNPKKETLIKIANALDVDAMYLIFGNQ